MPDTGAPWNIPYVEAADLVSDWPADSLALANAIADGLDEAGNAGIGSNVVQAIKTDAFTSSSGTFGTVTGLEVTITPSSASSKILILASVSSSGDGSSGDGGAFRIAGGNAATYVGGADGSRLQATTTTIRNADIWGSITQTMVYLDSPSTTSPVTYSVEGRSVTDPYYVNRSALDTNNASFVRTASSITAIEVAA